MQMTGKLEETKSKAAIINRTKRRLGGAEQEFKAGMGNLDGGRKKLGKTTRSQILAAVFRPRKTALQPTE